MSVSGKLVGPDVVPGALVQDPSTAAQFASVLPLVTDGQSLAALFALYVKNVGSLKNAAGTYDEWRAALGTTGILAVNSEGTKPTFNNAVVSFTPVATPTDFWGIVGSGTKTVRILKIKVTGVATAATPIYTQLLKRSAANTGSTPVALTFVQNDSGSAAITCTGKTYTTTNPTTGTLVGVIAAEYLNLGAASGGAAGTIEWVFGTRNGGGLVLRGTGEGVYLNWNAQAVPAGTLLTIEVELCEDNS